MELLCTHIFTYFVETFFFFFTVGIYFFTTYTVKMYLLRNIFKKVIIINIPTDIYY